MSVTSMVVRLATYFLILQPTGYPFYMYRIRVFHIYIIIILIYLKIIYLVFVNYIETEI